MSQSIAKVVIGIFVLIFAWAMFDSCSRQKRYSQVRNQAPSPVPATAPSYTNTVIPSAQLVAAADDFDLKVIERLLKESTSPEDFEKRLNADNPRVHNLDLDENEVVDFINVTEFGSGNNRGLSLSVELEPVNGEKQVQEVATILIEKSGANGGSYEVKGNESIYGTNHVFRSQFGLTDFLLMGFLFNQMARPPYYSSYGYNRYPSYYGYHRYYHRDAYRASSSSWGRGSQMTQVPTSDLSTKTAPSPNAGKTASNVKAPLKSPTSTQQAFQSRNPSKQVRSGGFGGGSSTSRTSTSTTSSSTRTTTSSSSSSSRPSQPSVRSSSSSRSGSRSGGGGGK